jgi:energy-coupling factor transporter ATP-binding protein EcfA2
MRLRGLVFERFASFDRGEVNFCDDAGAPLDAIVFVGESGAGKTALLRGIAGLLTEAASGQSELGANDVHRDAQDARCRLVFDDLLDSARAIVTIEKEIRSDGGGTLKGGPTFERWKSMLAASDEPRAAFAVETNADDETADDEAASADPLIEWLAGVSRDRVAPALERCLWPYKFSHVDDDAVAHFEVPGERAATSPAAELGEGFGSVLVMTLELLRLTLGRAGAELVYVIDDIDAHLHPRWQSRILGDFHRAFPNVQIIATTHSPYVVASLDPSQVFRIADGGIARVTERLQRGATVSSVMDTAFGTPDLPGPRWTHAPAKAIREEVRRVVEADLGRGSVLYVLPEPIHVREALDAFGEPAVPNADPSTGWLFFIDREPGVPWGHPCEFIFRGQDGAIFRRRAIWPPAKLDRFVPFARG